jgi:hypothetical protein
MDVETGELKGSLTSPILFALYMASIFKQAQNEAPGVTTLSCLDSVTFAVEVQDINQCTSYMQMGVKRAIQWGKMNSVHFDVATTQAVLILKKRDPRVTMS